MGEPFFSDKSPASRDRNIGNDYEPTEIIVRWEYNIRSQAGLHAVFDLDETLFDTATHWVNFTNTFLRFHGALTPQEKNRLPTHDQVFDEGGPGNYYPYHFSSVFPDDSYERLSDQLRHRYGANKRGKEMVDVAEVWVRTQKHAHILGSLTARPDTLQIRRSTERQLSDAGVLNHNGKPLDVLYKPDLLPIQDASKEKLRILTALANTSGAQGYIVLIDDSITTAEAIQQYNKDRGSKRPVIQIVNCDGPLTKPKIQKREFIEDTDNGIFFMDDWSKLESVLEKIKQWTCSHA